MSRFSDQTTAGGPLPLTNGGPGQSPEQQKFRSDVLDLIPVIGKDTLGLGLVDNTSDVQKPVSVAQAEAIAGKGNLVRFSTLAAAISAMSFVASAADRIELTGRASPGDSATPLTYSPLSSAPSPVRAWNFKTADNRWWELVSFDVCPEGMGADGTVAGDTAALQACQDYPRGRLIRSGSATYLLGSAGLVLSSSKTWVANRTIVKMVQAPTGDMVLSLFKTDFEISGVTFDGNGLLTGETSAYSPSFLPCVYIGGCSRFRVINCSAVGFKTCGLLFNFVADGVVSCNSVFKSDPTGVYPNYGISVVGAAGSLSTNIHIDQNTVIGTDISINTAYSWVTDNTVSGWGFSAGINVASAASCFGNTITGNKCHDCLRVPDRDNYFMDGIECWSPDTICHDNICWDCIGSGIGWGSRRGSCQGNSCYNNGLTQAEFAALGFPGATILGQGILSLADANPAFSAEDSHVANNTLYDTRVGAAKTQSFGYREITGYSFQNVTVHGNKINGSGTAPYSLNGTASVDFLPYPGGLQPYSPAVSAASGALGSGVVTNCFYQMLSTKLCHVELDVTIPNNGTGSDNVTVALPFPAAPARQQVFSGVETAVNGQVLAGVITGGAALVKIKGQSNSYPGASGMRLVLSGNYTIA